MTEWAKISAKSACNHPESIVRARSGSRIKWSTWSPNVSQHCTDHVGLIWSCSLPCMPSLDAELVVVLELVRLTPWPSVTWPRPIPIPTPTLILNWKKLSSSIQSPLSAGIRGVRCGGGHSFGGAWQINKQDGLEREGRVRNPIRYVFPQPFTALRVSRGELCDDDTRVRNILFLSVLLDKNNNNPSKCVLRLSNPNTQSH